MKKKINIDFDVFLDNALKSHGYLFPETDEQMEAYERNVELEELPSKFQTPSFVFDSKIPVISTRQCIDVEQTIVAGHIINICNTDDFGRVKFQKLLYLTEHIFQLDFDSNYERKVAGPYDGALLKKIETTLRRYNFYRIAQDNNNNKRVYYAPLSSSNELSALFETHFASEGNAVNQFLVKFKNLNWEQCEIIATLYAVWNNRIINRQEISDSVLKQDFLDWDPNKAKYKKRIDKALIWMKQQNIIPVGWGKVIK